MQRGEPHELALVEFAGHLTPVRHVDADHAHAVARGRDHVRVALVGVDVVVVEAGGHVVDPDARQDGHAVPLALAVVHGVVPERGERQVRERLVRELRLLQAEDVGPCVAQPLLDPLLAGLQRVDVPGGDPHARDVT